MLWAEWLGNLLTDWSKIVLSLLSFFVISFAKWNFQFCLLFAWTILFLFALILLETNCQAILHCLSSKLFYSNCFFFALLFCPDHTFKICLKQFENNIQDLAKEIVLIILEGRTIIFVENFDLSNIWNNMLCSALKTELSNSLIFGMKLMEAKCKTLVLLLLWILFVTISCQNADYWLRFCKHIDLIKRRHCSQCQANWITTYLTKSSVNKASLHHKWDTQQDWEKNWYSVWSIHWGDVKFVGHDTSTSASFPRVLDSQAPTDVPTRHKDSQRNLEVAKNPQVPVKKTQLLNCSSYLSGSDDYLFPFIFFSTLAFGHRSSAYYIIRLIYLDHDHYLS